MKSLNATSYKYGPCEVCHHDVSDVWITKVFKENKLENGDKVEVNAGVRFGHRECLVNFLEELGSKK